MQEHVFPVKQFEEKEGFCYTFTVIDPETGMYPDLNKITKTEDWAFGLTWCDLDCFAIQEDGHLILSDECGMTAYPPAGRFQVVFTQRAEANRALLGPELLQMDGEPVWVQTKIAGRGSWCLVDAENRALINARQTLTFDGIGQGVQVYKYRPKEDK